MFRIILCAFTLMLTPVAAWADVAALSHTNPENAPQTVSPTKQYLNPAGPLGLYLTAGLDRKVGCVLTKPLSFAYSPPTVQLSSGGQGTLNLRPR